MNEMKFRDFGFDEEILKALEKLEYYKPTKVQEKVMPLILQKKDIIVKSKTGSGKTASFAIPICENIELEQRSAQVLVLTPTRELAVQIKEDIAYIGRFKKIRCAAIFGRQSIEMQKRELSQRVHVIVATPGRLIDHIQRGNVNLEDIKYLIIDEADEMLNMGFLDQVESIISNLKKERITMLFSATMPQQIELICKKHMKDSIRIDIETEKSHESKINQFYYQISEKDKESLLNEIIYTQRPERCIIFCNTRDRVEKIIRIMKKKNYSCIGLHGGMEQGIRLSTIQKFKRGQFRFLVATDVAARGIHIDEVSHVVNYDMPLEKENYVHRIGRTGRAGKTGTAISMVLNSEKELMKEIENFIEKELVCTKRVNISEIEEGKILFESKVQMKPESKTDRSEKLNREITKIRINAGKKRKIRPGDIMGAISNIEGMSAKDIGIIDIQSTCSYVEIFGKKGDYVFNELQKTKIKGKIISMKKVRFRNF